MRSSIRGTLLAFEVDDGMKLPSFLHGPYTKVKEKWHGVVKDLLDRLALKQR